MVVVLLCSALSESLLERSHSHLFGVFGAGASPFVVVIAAAAAAALVAAGSRHRRRHGHRHHILHKGRERGQVLATAIK